MLKCIILHVMPALKYKHRVTKSANHERDLVRAVEAKWAPGRKLCRGEWTKIVDHLLTQYVACGVQVDVPERGNG